jgi:hypothetical protein
MEMLELADARRTRARQVQGLIRQINHPDAIAALADYAADLERNANALELAAAMLDEAVTRAVDLAVEIKDNFSGAQPPPKRLRTRSKRSDKQA